MPATDIVQQILQVVVVRVMLVAVVVVIRIVTVIVLGRVMMTMLLMHTTTILLLQHDNLPRQHRHQRASDEDKYVKIRNAASLFAIVLPTMLLHKKHQHPNPSATACTSASALGLNYLDEVCLLCFCHLDNEGVQVGLGWSLALARYVAIYSCWAQCHYTRRWW